MNPRTSVPQTEDEFPPPCWDDLGITLSICSQCGPAPTDGPYCVICGEPLLP